MSTLSDPASLLADSLRLSGRVASLEGLQELVVEFEEVLAQHRIEIEPGSALEKACLSVIEVLAKHELPELQTGAEDSRGLFRDVLGIWSLLKLIVTRRTHPDFGQFVPHLKLLNKGFVAQNSPLRVSDEASNKIFELLFALILLDVGTDLHLDHPSLAKGDNPDILVTIDGRRWGFAFKALYSSSPKTFFDNLKKGAEQIRDSEADLGSVVVNFRNLIDHDQFMPIQNPEQYAAGAEPDYGVYEDPQVISDLIKMTVRSKEMEVRNAIGDDNILNAFKDTRALPGFVAFFQTCARKWTFGGPVPSDICSLGIAPMVNWNDKVQVFQRMNEALHHRTATV